MKEIPYLGYVITSEGIKPEPNKLKGVMDFSRPSTNTKARALIGMFQYYRDMWPSWSHVLAPLTEASSSPKGRKISWNGALESSFKGLKLMVYVDTLLSYTD